jgi:hypothetical protein
VVDWLLNAARREIETRSSIAQFRPMLNRQSSISDGGDLLQLVREAFKTAREQVWYRAFDHYDEASVRLAHFKDNKRLTRAEQKELREATRRGTVEWSETSNDNAFSIKNDYMNFIIE